MYLIVETERLQSSIFKEQMNGHAHLEPLRKYDETASKGKQ